MPNGHFNSINKIVKKPTPEEIPETDCLTGECELTDLCCSLR
ncbi:predicted protein [Botrytis cinerea T4]|uniref:Uncharacterized protein n=1 Tax=Botryotinia fuckeliana (strain T4) TaxID=999810 RepID=G2YEV3_BOTF4|nr:predicted protein [Botrytis cinerea T4]